MKVKLAEALLRRKELNQKVAQLAEIKAKDCFEFKVRRQQVTENIDDIQASVPKVKMADLTKEYDHYAKQLRLVDAAIQQANWTTEIEVADSVLADFA